MRIALVAMPWQSLDTPSLPIGLLKAACIKAGFPDIVTYHASIHWAEYLLEQTSGEVTPEHYASVAENGVFDGIGDWIFSGALYPEWTNSTDRFVAYAAENGVDTVVPLRMRAHAPDFADQAAQRIVESEPDIVGFTTTFMQNVPSLAVAARVKAMTPQTTIAFGGGNCDGPMGQALHREFDFVDVVVRGEGEEALPRLLHALAGSGALAGIAGLCWRGPDGRSVGNPMTSVTVPTQSIPTPDFDDWFEALEASPIRPAVEPQLVLESARGCWWGERHHCTFCGLNGSTMKFRAKAPAAFVTELSTLVERHQTLDVMMVDNIVDNAYFASVFPALRELDWDLRLHYEIKANLRRAQIESLRAAGVVNVQPGIESLITSVLKLMDKGVSAIHNVRTLRDCESAGLTVSWNWLVGFPGETEAEYARALLQIPALVHLQPPLDASRIVLERFSPYFQRPELGFAQRRPARFYRHVYDLPEDVLMDLVYMFDTEPKGVSSTLLNELRHSIAGWRSSYPRSELVRQMDGASVLIEDRRDGWPERTYHITEPAFVAAYHLLEQGHTATGLARALADRCVDMPVEEIDGWLAELHEAGLTFVDAGRHVALATEKSPVKL